MKRRAPSKDDEHTEYLRERDIYLGINDNVYHPCEVCPRLHWVGLRPTLCTFIATEVHHRRKRGQGGSLLNKQGWVRSCHWGNVSGIEDNPGIAWEAGLVVRDGDDEFEALGARAWRKAAM